MLYKKSCHHLPLLGNSFLDSQDQIEYVETKFRLGKHEGEKWQPFYFFKENICIFNNILTHLLMKKEKNCFFL